MYNTLENKFWSYLSSFDKTDERIALKIEHTFKVVEIMDNLTSRLQLCQEYREIAHAIALFHDIGRFEQIRTYHTFIDANSIDHADFGCQIIQEQHFFEKHEELIVCAIHNHNKLRIEEGLDDLHLLMCRLIRDADKCDIFRVFATEEYPTLFGFTKEEIESSSVSEKVKASLLQHDCVRKEDRTKGIDFCLTFLGFFYDLYFDESIEYLMKNPLFRIPFSHLHFQKEKTKQDVDEIMEDLEIYLKKRLH